MNRRDFVIGAALAPPGAEPRSYLLHDEAEPIRALARFLERNGHRVSVEDQATFRRHMHSISAEAVFMYIHGEFDPEIEDFLIAYAERGGRLIVLHHGMASGKMASKRWMPFLGVKIFPHDDPDYPWRVLRGDFRLVNLSPSHYVTCHDVRYAKTVSYRPSDAPSTEQQLPAIELPDTEIFLNQVFTDGRRKTVLFGFKTEVDGKACMQDRAGWMMPCGEGFVFYFQPGHHARDFQNRDYAQILLNAVEWAPDSPSTDRSPSRSTTCGPRGTSFSLSAGLLPRATE